MSLHYRSNRPKPNSKSMQTKEKGLMTLIKLTSLLQKKNHIMAGVDQGFCVPGMHGEVTCKLPIPST